MGGWKEMMRMKFSVCLVGNYKWETFNGLVGLPQLEIFLFSFLFSFSGELKLNCEYLPKMDVLNIFLEIYFIYTEKAQLTDRTRGRKGFLFIFLW